MPVEIRTLNLREVRAARAQITAVYQAAFSQPPYCEGEAEFCQFAQAFPRHFRREGFCLAAARHAGTEELVGFAYGFCSQPGDWWHDVVAAALGPVRDLEWMGDAFELVEFAVHPAFQRQGVGKRLHDALLDGLPYRAVLLSTMQDETTGLGMYRASGWEELLANFWFPGVSSPYRVFGKKLP